MGFNSAFKGLNPGNGLLNNLNGPVLNVLRYEVFCFLEALEYITCIL